MKAYFEVLCDKLKLHHQSLGTYNTTEMIDQDQHLVKYFQEPLPTTYELDEVTQIEVATESRQTTPFPEAESSDD